MTEYRWFYCVLLVCLACDNFLVKSTSAADSPCLTVDVLLDIPIGMLSGGGSAAPDFEAAIQVINALTAAQQLPLTGVSGLFNVSVQWESQCFLLNVGPNYRLVGENTYVSTVPEVVLLSDQLCNNDVSTPPQALTVIDFTSVTSEMFSALNFVCNSYNIPTIGVFYDDAEFSNKQLYPYSTRMLGPANAEALALFEILQVYKWTRVAVIEGLSYSQAQTATEIQQLGQQTNTQVFLQTITYGAPCTSLINNIVNGDWKIVYLLGISVDVQKCLVEMLGTRQLGLMNYIVILSNVAMATFTAGTTDLSSIPHNINVNASLLKGLFGLDVPFVISPLGNEFIAARMALSPPLILNNANFGVHFQAWNAMTHAHQGVAGYIAKTVKLTVQQLNNTGGSNPRTLSPSADLASREDFIQNFTQAFLSVFSANGQLAADQLNFSANTAASNNNASFTVFVPSTSIRYNSSEIWFYYTNQSNTAMQSSSSVLTAVYDNNGDAVFSWYIFNFDGKQQQVVANFNELYNSYQPLANVSWPNSAILNEYELGWPADRTPPITFSLVCQGCVGAVSLSTWPISSLSAVTAGSSGNAKPVVPLFFTSVSNLQTVYQLSYSIDNPSLSQIQYSCDGTAPIQYSFSPTLPALSASAISTSTFATTSAPISLTTSTAGQIFQINGAQLGSTVYALYNANPSLFQSPASMTALSAGQLLQMFNSSSVQATASIISVLNGQSIDPQFTISFLLTCSNAANVISAVFSIVILPPSDIYTPSTDTQNAMIAFNSLGLFLVAVMSMLVYLHRDHKVIFSSSPVFLASILCGFACLFVSSLLSILPATTPICQSKLILFHFGFVLALGSIFVKTYRLHRIFNSKVLLNITVPDGKLLIGISGLLAVDAIILACWIQANGYALNSTQKPYCYSASNGDVVFPAIFSSTKGALLLFGVYLTKKVQSLPANFNESRDISIVIYNTSVFAVIYMAVFFAISLQPAQLSIFTSVMLFAAAFVNLLVFFGPKIIAMRGVLMKFGESGVSSAISAFRKRQKQNPAGSMGLSFVPGSNVAAHTRPAAAARQRSSISQPTGSTGAQLPVSTSKSAGLDEAAGGTEETKTSAHNPDDMLRELKKHFLTKINGVKARESELTRLGKRTAEVTKGISNLYDELRTLVLTIRLVLHKVNRSHESKVDPVLEAELAQLIDLPIDAVRVDAANPSHYDVADGFQDRLAASKKPISNKRSSALSSNGQQVSASAGLPHQPNAFTNKESAAVIEAEPSNVVQIDALASPSVMTPLSASGQQRTQI